VRWLMVGSVPAAFAGVLVLRALGDGALVQARIRQVQDVRTNCSSRPTKRPTAPEANLGRPGDGP
jgi:hypothetical protein